MASLGSPDSGTVDPPDSDSPPPDAWGCPGPGFRGRAALPLYTKVDLISYIQATTMCKMRKLYLKNQII